VREKKAQEPVLEVLQLQGTELELPEASLVLEIELPQAFLVLGLEALPRLQAMVIFDLS